MKNIITLLTFGLLLTATSLFAQSTCDGSRYIEDVFTEITTTSGVEYGANLNVPGNQQTLRMNIFEPAGDTAEKRPLIIFAHGGSFIFGNRDDMNGLCQSYTRKGYVTATIDYRLWPILAGIPDSLDMLDVVVKAVHDMRAATRFFRADAATTNTYRIDTDNILVGGLSAGAVMAVQTGTMDESDNIPDFIMDIIEANGGINGNSGNEEYSSDVAGIINLSGGIYSVDWLDENDPPILSMHGTSDGTVPYEYGLAAGIMSLNGSGLVTPRAEAMGVANYFISVPGGGHTDIYTEEAYADYQLELAVEGNIFLESIICQNATTSTDAVDVSAQVSVFPNPSTDVITIELADINSTYELMVYNQLGQKVHYIPSTEETISLNKNNIGKGFFTIQIQFEDKKIAPVTKRIVFVD